MSIAAQVRLESRARREDQCRKTMTPQCEPSTSTTTTDPCAHVPRPVSLHVPSHSRSAVFLNTTRPPSMAAGILKEVPHRTSPSIIINSSWQCARCGDAHDHTHFPLKHPDSIEITRFSPYALSLPATQLFSRACSVANPGDDRDRGPRPARGRGSTVARRAALVRHSAIAVARWLLPPRLCTPRPAARLRCGPCRADASSRKGRAEPARAAPLPSLALSALASGPWGDLAGVLTCCRTTGWRPRSRPCRTP